MWLEGRVLQLQKGDGAPQKVVGPDPHLEAVDGYILGLRGARAPQCPF